MAANLVDLALTHIAAKVEPLTRFDRSVLRMESGQARVTAGQASWLFTVTISNEPTRHKGRLYQANAPSLIV